MPMRRDEEAVNMREFTVVVQECPWALLRVAVEPDQTSYFPATSVSVATASGQTGVCIYEDDLIAVFGSPCANGIVLRIVVRTPETASTKFAGAA
jgi:hypothetical protein